MTDISPRFPPELERAIFEIAVHDKKNKGCVNFMLVAHRVHDWIASVIYCVASQLVQSYFPPQNNVSTASVEYFGAFVKHLIIGGPYLNQDSLITFLKACQNLGDLALWTHIPTRELLPVLRMLSLTRLSINLAGLTFEELTDSVFTHITHLDIIGFESGSHIGWSEWRAFTHFNSLTHLAINEVMDNSPDEIIHNLLRDCQRLQILLIVEVMNPWELKNVPFNDPCLILMKIQRYVCEDWIQGAKGNENMWLCAEEISRAKQAGFFKIIDYPDMWFTRYGYREELYQRCGYPK